MSYWKIIPDKLVDWIEQQRNPERYHRLINVLLRISNWGDGTYKDGIEVKRGEKRISINELSRLLKYSYGSVWDMLKKLQKAGWISIHNHYKLTIISLNWLTDCDTKLDNRFEKNPITETEKPDNKPDNRNLSATTINSDNPDNKPDNKIQKTRYQNQAQPDIRNNKNYKEIKEFEIKEEKYNESNNSDARSEKLDFEERKERLKVLKQKVKEEIEFQEVTSLSLQQITEAALKVRKKFAEVYKEKNKNLPAIRSHEFSQLKKLIALSCPDEEALKEWLEALLPKVENFWRIRNDFTRKHGHTFYTFVHTIPEILEGKGESINPKPGTKRDVLEVKVW